MSSSDPGNGQLRGQDSGTARTKADLVTDALREEIMMGIRAPGARLQQEELAARFKTSITPVREALKRLEAEGLLAGKAHHGVTVASPNLEQITSIFILRHQIEPLAATRSAIRLTRLDFERAARINEELVTAYATEGDEVVARALNREFHFIFYGGCGLPTLIQEIDRLWAAFPWATLQTRRTRQQGSAVEHSKMLEAVQKNDPELIQSTFERHIEHGFLALMRQLGGVEELPDPLTSQEA